MIPIYKLQLLFFYDHLKESYCFWRVEDVEVGTRWTYMAIFTRVTSINAVHSWFKDQQLYYICTSVSSVYIYMQSMNYNDFQ